MCAGLGAAGSGLSPEECLVVEGSRPPRPDGPGETITAIATQPTLPWERVARLAAWHRSSTLLHHNLGAAGVADHVPEPIADDLRSTYSETVARNLRLGAELERLIAALSGAGLAVVLLKGAALVPDYYDDVGLRPMSDLDLLLHKIDVERADGVLRELGYREPPGYESAEHRQRARLQDHHWPPLISRDGMVAVELHHRLGSRESLLDFEVDRLWARAQPVTRGAASCLAPAPADLLMHACLHFLKHHHCASYGALGQLTDVALLVERAGMAIDWEVVTSEACRIGVRQSLHFVLVLTRELLGAKPPPEALTELWRLGASDAMVDEFVRRRVFRASRWRTLEQLSPRWGALRQLLPPRPRTAWTQSKGQARRPRRVAETYLRWAVAAGRVVADPRSIRAERAFERKLLEVMAVRPGGVT